MLSGNVRDTSPPRAFGDFKITPLVPVLVPSRSFSVPPFVACLPTFSVSIEEFESTIIVYD